MVSPTASCVTLTSPVKVFVLRKRATHGVTRPGARFYVISLSSTTIVYKGQLTSEQVWTYFKDLQVSAAGRRDTLIVSIHGWLTKSQELARNGVALRGRQKAEVTTKL